MWQGRGGMGVAQAAFRYPCRAGVSHRCPHALRVCMLIRSTQAAGLVLTVCVSYHREWLWVTLVVMAGGTGWWAPCVASGEPPVVALSHVAAICGGQSVLAKSHAVAARRDRRCCVLPHARQERLCIQNPEFHVFAQHWICLSTVDACLETMLNLKL